VGVNGHAFDHRLGRIAIRLRLLDEAKPLDRAAFDDTAALACSGAVGERVAVTADKARECRVERR